MSKANQPYIFISYAHKDKELIDPFITALKEKYEVWFDEGIRYGREWEEEIAAKLDECSIFIFAVTENSLDSKNCRDELTLARDTDKRFLNVVFSDDIELPSWFKLRYARYQMCYYNRFPSARAVVDDLGQKCEWFEDVKLPAFQSAEQEKAEDISLKYVTNEKETAEKTSDEAQNQNIYREKTKDISAQSVIPPSVPLPEAAGKKQCEANSENKESDEKYESSLPRKYTRKQITEAVKYAEKTDQEKRPFYTINRYIRLYEDMTEKQITNLIGRATYKITKENIVAMCGDPLIDNGSTGVLITEACLYCSNDKFFISNGGSVFHSELLVIISEVASVKLLPGDRRIKISYDDSTSRIFDFDHYAPIVYYFLDRLINS